MIDLMPNLTFFVQMAIFLIAMISLNYLVFRPVLRILARRRELTEGARAEARSLGDKTDSMVAAYAAEIQVARGEGLKEKEQLTQEGETEARQLMAEARKRMEASLEKNRRQVLADSREAQLALKKYSRELSREMAEKLIGRKVSA